MTISSLQREIIIETYSEKQQLSITENTKKCTELHTSLLTVAISFGF